MVMKKLDYGKDGEMAIIHFIILREIGVVYTWK
jgi:hypothetical protein